MHHLLLSLSILLVVGNNVIALPKDQFASPLKTFTLFDEKSTSISPREKYRMKYKAGLAAETKVREEYAQKREDFLETADKKAAGWENKYMAFERKLKARTDKVAKQAYEKAVKEVETSFKKEPSTLSIKSSKYQFVGVIDKKTNKVKWHARKRRKRTKWSLRIVHVDQGAVIKDLYNRGKVDIFAKYSKGNRPAITITKDGDKEETSKAIPIKGEYSVRERSWRALWNFSPKHFFTDPAGTFWRERRLRPGIYTDGQSVFETSYHYGEGQNGIRQIQELDEFLEDKTVSKATKQKAVQCMKRQKPDLVIES